MFWDASGLYQDHLANAVASFGLQNHTAVLAEVGRWPLAARWLPPPPAGHPAGMPVCGLVRMLLPCMHN